MLHLLLQFDFVADQADSVYSTLDAGCKCLGAVFGLVGAIRIYNKWQLHGHHHLHIDKEIVGGIGASFFFLLVDVFISSILL